jgi:hypothetical protein
MDFLNHREGVWFSIRLFSLLPYSVQQLNFRKNVRGCVSLKK